MDYFDEHHYYDDHPNNVRLITRRVIDRSDPLNGYSELEFRDRFRMRKEAFSSLFDLLALTDGRDQRGNPIPARLALLVTLRYYACDVFHRESGELTTISKSAACVKIHEVTRQINQLFRDFINFPDAQKQATNKLGFHAIAVSDYPIICTRLHNNL